jgi:hypothetical protein
VFAARGRQYMPQSAGLRAHRSSAVFAVVEDPILRRNRSSGRFYKLSVTPRNSVRISSVIIQGAKVFYAKSPRSDERERVSVLVGPTQAAFSPRLFIFILFLFPAEL